MIIHDALTHAADALKAITDRPMLEAEILLSEILGQNRIYLHTHGLETLKETEVFLEHVRRRACGEPLEYLTHKVSFHAFEFFVDYGALIPRPETEILVEKVQEIITHKGVSQIAEVGVGSGAVICSLALLNPSLHFYGSDISHAALKIAHKNIMLHGLEDRITLKHSAFLDQFSTSFELLYSNPPYIRNSYPLPLPVTFEPPEALFGGEDGMDILKELVILAHKRRITFLACEMGYDQKDMMYHFLKHNISYNFLEFYQDLAGLDRGFVLELKF